MLKSDVNFAKAVSKHIILAVILVVFSASLPAYSQAALMAVLNGITPFV